MRFMMIVKASKDSEAGIMPSEQLLAAMAKYNEELAKAGVLLDATGRCNAAFLMVTHNRAIAAGAGRTLRMKGGMLR